MGRPKPLRADDRVVPGDDAGAIVTPEADVRQAVGKDRETRRRSEPGNGLGETPLIERPADDQPAPHPGKSVGKPSEIARRKRPATTQDVDVGWLLRGPFRFERSLRDERFAEREVDVDGARGRLRSRRHRPAHDPPQMGLEKRRYLRHGELRVPLREARVEMILVDRLGGRPVAQLGRSVGGQDNERDAALASLHDGRREVHDGGSGRTQDHRRAAARAGDPEREVRSRPLVEMEPGPDRRVGPESQRDWRRP